MCHRLFIPVVFLALCGVSAGQEDVPALIHKLKDKDLGTRQKAARALGKLGAAAVPVLIAVLKDEDENKDARSGAALALGEIGSAAKEAVPALIAALKDKDKQVRTNAAYALG